MTRHIELNKCCHQGCTADGCVSVPSWKRGGKPIVMCRYHAEHVYNYSTKNSLVYGKLTDGFSYSIEKETVGHDEKVRAELFDVGFIATKDISLGSRGVEFKSPIYMNLKAPIKHAITIGRLIDEGHMDIDYRCGTHFHVGHVDYINSVTMRYCRRFYNSLFVPLCEEIMSDLEKSAKLFGRKPNTYCPPVTRNTVSGNLNGDAMPHSIMFNLQHDATIEFRQCKFHDVEQYQECMRFCKEITACIIEEFIKHFMDTNYPRPEGVRYPRDAYRKGLADKTAQEMVRIYRRYTNNL